MGYVLGWKVGVVIFILHILQAILWLCSTVFALIPHLALCLLLYLRWDFLLLKSTVEMIDSWALMTFLGVWIVIKDFIIMSCHRHGYPWPSVATSPYRSLPLAGLQGYISYPHIAAVCMFELVILLLPGHMWGSIGVHHLWARPCFSSSVLHVWFVWLG